MEGSFRRTFPEFRLVPPALAVTFLTLIRRLWLLVVLGVTVGTPIRLTGQAVVAPPARGWVVKTRPHIDVWLHGFALLSPPDSALVPLFSPAYRDAVVVAKNARNLLTALDANADSLRSRYARSPQLLQAQFLAFRFADLAELAGAMELFIRADGEPRRAGSREMAEVVGELGAVFPSARERDWARLFVEGLRDEDARFYGAWWKEQQTARRPVLLAVDSLWTTTWQPAMLRYLARSQQRSGDIVLTLSLAGEGRAGAARTGSIIAVPFPERIEDATQVLYVVAHEAVGSLAGGAIVDNTTPAEQRAGVAARYVASAQVIAGYELLSRVLPAMADGYARYYLEQRRTPSTLSGPALGRALADAFALPPAIVEALRRQLDITLSGI